MTLNKFLLMLALGAQFMFMTSGCGQHEEESTEDETEEAETEAEDEPEAEEPAAEEPAAQNEPAAGGGSACDRAQRCCEAYVGEMTAMAGGTATVTTEQACAGIAGARAAGAGGDATCNTMIGSWRQSLEAAQRTVPGDCAAQ